MTVFGMPSRGEKYTEKKRRMKDHGKVLPLLASDARVLPTRGSTFCMPALLCILLSAKLHAPRSITGFDPTVITHSTVHLCFNRNSFYLTYIGLSVFVRVCVYARLSYSLSFARLTCSPVVSRPTRSPNSSLLAFLIPPWSCQTSTHPRG